MDPHSPILWLLGATAFIIAGALLKPSLSTDTPENRKLLFGTMLAATALGAYLRFSVLDFGFPELYHPDEYTKGRVLVGMSKRMTWNPNYFLHPSLLLYSAKLVAKCFRILDIYAANDMLRYILAGRFVSATAGTLAIPLVFLIGASLDLRRKFFAGTLASLAVATLPLHLTCSRYFKEDALFTTLLLVVTLFCLRFLATRRVREILVAGLAGGVCMGAKYTGGISLLLPFAAASYAYLGSGVTREQIIRWIAVGAAVGAAAAIAFVLTTPFAVLTPSKFFGGLLYERNHVLRGHGGISITAWDQLWTYHLSRSLPRGMTLPVLLVALLGVGRALRRRKSADLLLLVGLAAFYGIAEYVKAKPMPQPDRYALPAALFLVLSGAALLSELRLRYIEAAMGALLIVLAFRQTGSVRPDTREKMAQWIQANIQPAEKLMIVGLPYYVPRLARYGYSVYYLSPENNRRHTTVERLRLSDRQLLLVTSLSYDRFFTQPKADQGLRERFEQYAQSFPLLHEESIPGGSFGFHNPTLKLYRLPAPASPVTAPTVDATEEDVEKDDVQGR